MKKYVKLFICLAIAAIVLTCTVFADAPEYTSSYDTPLGSGTHGYGVRGYDTGGLFNLYKCRAWSELWGDSSAVSSFSGRAYVRVANTNKGVSDSSTNTTIDSNRYCGAYTSRIGARYATNISHEVRMYWNGSRQFDESYYRP